MRQKIILVLAFCAGLAFVNAGCRPNCDSVPTESVANLRILNAVSNSSLLLVYIDGKLFDSCWYDVEHNYGYPWNSKHIFGYRSTYLSDGSLLRAGQHHVASVDAATRDTVSTWDGILRDSRQSLIMVGRIQGSAQQKPETIYLSDVTREPDTTHSYIRFVNAVPDISGTTLGGLDVYFGDSTEGFKKPSLRIYFGHISDSSGGDNGTGLSDTDYLEMPRVVPGLLILPIGDTAINDAILNVQYSLPTTGFLATVVVRGETQPLDNDPIASTLVLEDGTEYLGTVAFDVPSFFVRLVNASRYSNLSLLIAGISDTVPRAGIPQNAGQDVLNLGTDSVGSYIPLNPTYDGSSRYWFSKSNNASDTMFFFRRIEAADERSTFIAIDTIPHNTGSPGLDSMILVDTLSNPSDYDQSDTTHGEVRFVNTSPDYTANFTFAGQQFSMKQRDVSVIVASTGTYSIPVTDGATSGTIVFTVTDTRPTTIFFMPSEPSNPVPYRISTE